MSLSSGAVNLEGVTNSRLFATPYRTPQLNLFALEDVLGDGGWLKVLRLEEYAPRKSPPAHSLTAGAFLVRGCPLVATSRRARDVLVFPSPVDLVGEA